MGDLFRRMPLEQLMAGATRPAGLRRVLGFWQLTGIGLGGIIGVGIFVLTGIVAATQAGPAVAISFLIAGTASAAAALCYAEFASMIPVAGSAYTYSYAVLGEFAAWLIGWALLLEYALIVAVVSIGWSGYVQTVLAAYGVYLPDWALGAYGTGPGRIVNVTAMIGTLAVAFLLTFRTEVGARLNLIMVIVKIGAIVLVIVAGAPHVDAANWKDFMPFGFSHVVSGAAVVFFAVFGYEALTAAAEEARNPQRDVPRAVVASLAIAMLLYVAMSLVLTGMVHYSTLNNPAPVATAFLAIGENWVALVVSVAAVIGITTAMIAFMLSCARIWFALSRDGLLPGYFGVLHARHRTPHRTTLAAGALISIAAGLLPILELAKLINLGVLSAFVVVCGSIMVLRRTRPNISRAFRTPFVPVVPLVGIAFSLWLMSHLAVVTWAFFLAWLALGSLIYFAYGRSRSILNGRVVAETEG